MAHEKPNKNKDNNDELPAVELESLAFLDLSVPDFETADEKTIREWVDLTFPEDMRESMFDGILKLVGKDTSDSI